MSENRDKLLMEALEDESFHYLVESFECIPVKSAYTGSKVLVNVLWHIHHRCFSMVELQHAFKCKITNIFPIPKDFLFLAASC
jgi:hypothetical protein